MQNPTKQIGTRTVLSLTAAMIAGGMTQTTLADDSHAPHKSSPPKKPTADATKKPVESPAPSQPNILIILLDDAGYAQSDVVGGEIHTPTFARIADAGIRYNTFHTTAISSATRASLLTGRNHHHVGNGTITELATDYPGYNGTIPASAATVPQVLQTRGYNTVAFGKWHNTPTSETSSKGPYTHWPTNYGFDHFYGFIGGETDQYHPSLFNDLTPVEAPNDPKYILTEDLSSKAVAWLDQHQATTPNKPFFMYWAPGGVHAPHQVFKEWADKYKGKFDTGWDAYRNRAYERQKALGWIPPETVNTPRPAEMAAWDSLGPEEKKYQARLMEVYAGFLEHTDTQAGKVVDELDKLGVRDNTLIFYVFSDNGASSEGMQGSINDLAGLNGITVTAKEGMKALNEMYGGLDALGGPKLEEHYSAAWAWAGESPFIGTKLMAGYFGGTRTPLAISWPKHITPDKTIRTQFHHVNDIVPTIYDVLGITPPTVFHGVKQEGIDGVSMAYSFNAPTAPTHKTQQYFEMMGSRAEYADGWIASVFGPRKPWVADASGMFSWSGKLAILLHQRWIGETFGWQVWKPEDDKWGLYNLQNDFSQAHDLSGGNPAKVAELKKKFDADAIANHVLPLGAPFERVIDYALSAKGPGEWHFSADTTRLPETAAPNIKARDNIVSVDAEFPANANGVLFSLGDVGAGLTLYIMDGILCYEYNDFATTRIKIRATEKLPAGHYVVDAQMDLSYNIINAPATVKLHVNGKEVAKGKVPFTPLSFTATGTFNVGRSVGSPVSLDYFDRAPFAFTREDQ